MRFLLFTTSILLRVHTHIIQEFIGDLYIFTFIFKTIKAGKSVTVKNIRRDTLTVYRIRHQIKQKTEVNEFLEKSVLVGGSNGPPIFNHIQPFPNNYLH